MSASPDASDQHELIVDRRGSVQWVTFNRPHSRNALTWAMYDQLQAVCAMVNRDPQVRVMVLTGAGNAFVAGTDIALLQHVENERDVLEYEARGDALFSALETVRVPTIAAIAGACTGAGAIIAAICDLRLAAPSARYGVPVARTLGNSLSMANYTRLAGLLGVARLKDLILRARLMDAAEMAAAGLLSELAEEGRLLERATAIAEEVASFAPLTLWASRQALRRIRDRGAPPDAGVDLLLRCYLSRDFKEGVRAFLEKRAARWSEVAPPPEL